MSTHRKKTEHLFWSPKLQQCHTQKPSRGAVSQCKIPPHGEEGWEGMGRIFTSRSQAQMQPIPACMMFITHQQTLCMGCQEMTLLPEIAVLPGERQKNSRIPQMNSPTQHLGYTPAGTALWPKHHGCRPGKLKLLRGNSVSSAGSTSWFPAIESERGKRNHKSVFKSPSPLPPGWWPHVVQRPQIKQITEKEERWIIL